MVKAYHVELTETEKSCLQGMVKGGKHSARALTRARILLLAAQGRTDDDIADALQVGTTTIERIRKRYSTNGLDDALAERPRPGNGNKKLNEKGEAMLVATVCSTPPNGRQEWTMQLLADRMVELGMVGSISDETVRRTLKKMTLSRGKNSSGVSRKSAGRS